MTPDEPIELRTGAGRVYGRLTALAWLLAMGSLTLTSRSLHWSLVIGSLAVVGSFWPCAARLRETATLRLHSNGAAELGEAQGAWTPSPRVSRWVAVVRVELPGHTRRVLVCASRNHRQDYRRLLVWSRFPPAGTRPEFAAPRSSHPG